MREFRDAHWGSKGMFAVRATIDSGSISSSRTHGRSGETRTTASGHFAGAGAGRSLTLARWLIGLSMAAMARVCAGSEADTAAAQSQPAQPASAPSSQAHRAKAGHGEEKDRSAAPPANPDPMAMMEAMDASDHWTAMLHGFAFLNVNRQGGRSGDRDFESQNHVMAFAARRWLGGKLSLLGTFTLEPATIPRQGSSELFQRGETYRGVLLVDRQHPHDLFLQLAARWEKDLSPARAPGSLRLHLYAAPLGEPALGPTAYPHRLSASENPTAPLAHHNQDSTHLSADVLTAGITAGITTIEGSLFHGREPDAKRWDIEQGGLDSYSGRVIVRPLPGLALQASAGHRNKPEELEEGNQTRETVSAEYTRATPGGFLAGALVLGRNRLPAAQRERGNTLEATWKFSGRNFLYGRIESVDRDLFELIHKRGRPASIPPARTSVRAATIGFTRNLALIKAFHAAESDPGAARAQAETGLGVDLTVYDFSSRLGSVYGSSPVSLHVFLRLRFGAHGSAGHEHMHM